MMSQGHLGSPQRYSKQLIHSPKILESRLFYVMWLINRMKRYLRVSACRSAQYVRVFIVEGASFEVR